MREKIMENRGITLIALVITIIVLLILAGVSISMLTGENGILNQANKAVEETEYAKLKEEVQLCYEEALIENKVNGQDEIKSIYEGILKKEDANSQVILSENGLIVLYKNNYFELDKNGQVTNVTKTTIEVDWETAKVLVIADNNTTGYTEINEATEFASSKESATILLLDNIEGNAQYFINISGKDIILNLNGYTIKNNYSIGYSNYILNVEAEKIKIINGALISTSSIFGGGIYIKDTNIEATISNIKSETNSESLLNETSGKTDLYDCELKGNLANNHAYSCIRNKSTLNIYSGNYYNDSSFNIPGGLTISVIYNTGELNIFEANIKGIGRLISNSGIVTINNGNFGTDGKGEIYNGTTGNMYIYNTKIGNETAGVINNLGNLYIYNCEKLYSITGNTGTTYIYGGIIGLIQYNTVIMEDGTVNYIYQPKSVEIKGGHLTRNDTCLRLWGGTANISGGAFESNIYSGNNATVNITGGLFKTRPSSSFIAEGYTCIGPNENGYYEVVEE